MVPETLKLAEEVAQAVSSGWRVPETVAPETVSEPARALGWAEAAVVNFQLPVTAL